MNQNQDINVLWQELEDARHRFLRSVQSWTPDEINAGPDGGWNVVKIIEHILESEKGVLGYMMKKTSSGWESLDLAGPEHEAAGNALIARLASRERYAMPAVLSEPPGGGSLEALSEEWQRIRNKMDAFIRSLDPAFYPRLVFRQPVAGPLHLYHTLAFLRYHIDHHGYQVERIREALDKS